MSQRAFSGILVVFMFIVVGIYAVVNGFRPDWAGLMSAGLLTTLAPLMLVGTTLNAWFDVIDTKVAEGSLPPNDIGAMFKMAEFYTALVACLAGVIQVFNITPLDQETQAVLVNFLLLFATIIFRSFAQRTPGAETFAFQALVEGGDVTYHPYDRPSTAGYTGWYEHNGISVGYRTTEGEFRPAPR